MINSRVVKKSELKGSCLCGGLAYVVADDFKYALNCHCSKCRRATGAAFKSFGGIEFEKISIVSGIDNILKYGDGTDHDIHCKLCGSLIYSVVREAKFVHVTYGSLIDSPTLKPAAHIYVASKAPWFEITDQLPQFADLP